MIAIFFLLLQDDPPERVVASLIEQMRGGLEARRQAAQTLWTQYQIRPELGPHIDKALDAERDPRIRARLESIAGLTDYRPECDYPAPAALEGARIVGETIVGRAGNLIVAHRLKDGEKVWEARIDGTVTYAPLAIGDQHVIAHASDDRVTCFDAQIGKTLWSGSARFTGDRPALAAGVWAARGTAELKGIDADSGRTLWEARMTSKAVAASGRTIVALQENGDPVAIDARTGTSRWRSGLPFLGGSIETAGGRALVVGQQEVLCFDGRSGEKLWHFKETAVLNDCVSGFEEVVFAVSADQDLWCLDARTGRKLWKRGRLGSAEWGRRPAVQAAWFAFVEEPAGQVFFLKRDTGEKFRRDQPLAGSILATDGTRVVIQSQNRWLVYRAR
jgi:outer membrane protein assembly factor BamB